MEITQHYLKIHIKDSDEDGEMELIYRGNESIFITYQECSNTGNMRSLKVPRHILEQFIEMIE